jgi:hypothetical protein
MNIGKFRPILEIPVVTDKTGFRRDFGNLGREKKPLLGTHHA